MRVPPAAPASPPPPPRPLRVLVITLEFAASTFSGNGVYARSQARALARAGHRVLVVSGRPDDLDDAAAESAASDPTADDDDASRPIVRTVPVPAATWGRLDASCGHAAFASAAAASREITRAIASHAPGGRARRGLVVLPRVGRAPRRAAELDLAAACTAVRVLQLPRLLADGRRARDASSAGGGRGGGRRRRRRAVRRRRGLRRRAARAARRRGRAVRRAPAAARGRPRDGDGDGE
jgi:hypothetical protein